MRMPTLKRRWTADDLADLPDDGQRYEVIDGELFVTPAPSLRHQRAIFELARILADYVESEGIGDMIIAPADVRFSDARNVQPDVFVMPLVDGRRPRRFEDAGRLLLAVEVLSPSTARAVCTSAFCSARRAWRNIGSSTSMHARSSDRRRPTRASTCSPTVSSGGPRAPRPRSRSTCSSTSPGCSTTERRDARRR